MRSIRKYVQEKTVPIPRDEVWSLLSDTNHMHRVIQSFKAALEIQQHVDEFNATATNAQDSLSEHSSSIVKE
jgi:carbon monoxide dehydrogenase subunit G